MRSSGAPLRRGCPGGPSCVTREESALRHLLIRLQAVLLAVTLLAVLAVPAFGWSVITNYLTMNDYSFNDSQSVDVRAKTTFDQAPFPPTLYPSNFITAINYYHLRSPSVYYIAGNSSSYVYRSSIGLIDNQPGYYWDTSGWFMFLATWEVRATFHASTSCPDSYVRHFHGQTDKWWNSSGPDIFRWTTHNSC